MKRTIAVVVATLFASHLAAAETQRYLIGTRASAHAEARRIFRDHDETRVVREFEEVGALAADLTADEAQALRRSGTVRYVEEVQERHLFDTTPHALTPATRSSQYLAQVVPWGIDTVRARELWPLTRGSGPVNIAIFDTGVDPTHPDLAGGIGGMYNTLTKGDDARDDNDHGTHVAGTIAARDNGFGVVGVAPEAKIWAVKVLNNAGGGTSENIVEGVEWTIAWKRVVGGNWIVSLSLGAELPSSAERDAFKRLHDEGILVIAATGNDSRASISYPAGYPTVLAVGAIDRSSKVASFSNGGAGIGVVAPGVGVASTVPQNSVAVSSAKLDSGDVYVSTPLGGSASGDVTARYVYCGWGIGPSDFPPSVRGNIALIQRGASVTFNEKVRNAKTAGAAGVVIFNSDDFSPMRWSLILSECINNDCRPSADDLAFPWPVTVAISHADGEKLLARGGATITIGAWIDSYDTYNGTSMATPHVTGVAALLWTLAPKASADQIRAAIEAGASDIGDKGYDLRAGFGIADALTSAKMLAPQLFGLPGAPPPPPPSTRRRTARP